MNLIHLWMVFKSYLESFLVCKEGTNYVYIQY